MMDDRFIFFSLGSPLLVFHVPVFFHWGSLRSEGARLHSLLRLGQVKIVTCAHTLFFLPLSPLGVSVCECVSHLSLPLLLYSDCLSPTPTQYTHTHTDTCMRAHTYIMTQTHTHIHTHTHVPSAPLLLPRLPSSWWRAPVCVCVCVCVCVSIRGRAKR